MIEEDLSFAISSFKAGAASAASGDTLSLAGWSDADWETLFGLADRRKVAAGEPLIRRGETSRTLYFVLSGRLEVIARTNDAHSIGPLTHVGAGSVLGEQAFFDGEPRSASAWAVDDCEIAALSPERFRELERDHPKLALALLFSLGQVLAARLRTTTARIAR